MKHIKDNSGQGNQAFRVSRCSIWLVCYCLAAVTPQLCYSAQEGFILPSNTGCACVGEIKTYRCTTVGAGSTIWRGTAFQCVGSSILLRHSQFSAPGGDSGDCNGGDITARSIGVSGNCYTSQLSVMVSRGLNNRSVTCTYDFGTGVETVNTSILNVVEAPISPPSNVRLANAQQGILIFSWDSLGPNCESVNYHILFSCGTCPNITNSTQVTCSDLKLSTIAKECAFMIRTELCGDNTGNPSDPVMVTLKLPDTPDVLQVIPVYSNVNRALIRIYAAINQTVPFDIVDDMPASVTYYNISLSTDSTVVFSSEFFPSCVNGQCEISITVPLCPSQLQGDIGVTFSATNILGTGSMSDATYIGCTNNFVEVTEYNSAASTITCSFLNQLDSTESVKSCSVQYGELFSGECQKLISTSYGNSTGNSVTLNVQLSGSSKEYCYIVTASNGTHTVMVEGRISITGGGLSVAATVIVVIVIVIIISVIIVAPVVYIFCKKRCKHEFHKKASDKGSLRHELLTAAAGTIEDEMKSDEPITETHFVEPNGDAAINDEKKVAEEIEQFVSVSDDETVIITKKGTAEEPTLVESLNLTEMNLEGVWTINVESKEAKDVKDILSEHGYFGNFHFAREFLSNEDISEKERLIFYSQETGRCLRPIVNTNVLRSNKLFGKRVSPPSLKNYAVFIQSTRPESRHLQKGRILIYKPSEEQSSQEEWLLVQLPACQQNVSTAAIQDSSKGNHFEVAPLRQPQRLMICVDSTKFAMRKVTSEHTLKEFCEQCDPPADIHSVYIEPHSFVDDQTPLDVMLVDKDTCMVYTGTFAMNMARKCKENAVIDDHWRIFVFMEYEETFQMKKGMYILYQKEQQIKSFPDQPKSPLLCIDKGQFDVESKPKEPCTIAQFRCSHSLEAGEHNIFVKVKKLDDKSQTQDVLDVILEDKVTGELYTCRAAWEVVKFYARKSTDTKKWRVFVMKYFEDNFLITTQVLYRTRTRGSSSNNLLKMYSDHFLITKLQRDYKSIGDFQAAQSCKNVFVELQEGQNFQNIIDVILVKKNSEPLSFHSGPYARLMVKEHMEGTRRIDRNEWEVFVYYRDRITIKLQKNTPAMYQDPQAGNKEYQVLKVETDGTQMSEFILQHFKTCEVDRVFYELVQEDLISYREILYVPLQVFDSKGKEGSVIQLQSNTWLFYGIQGTPGWGIIPQVEEMKIFVQSISQRSRRLKSGTYILYKVKSEDIKKSDVFRLAITLVAK